jgi:hypothetical protein
MYHILGFYRRFIFHIKLDEEKGELGISPAERTLNRRPFEPDPGNTGGGKEK